MYFSVEWQGHYVSTECSKTTYVFFNNLYSNIYLTVLIGTLQLKYKYTVVKIDDELFSATKKNKIVISVE